MWVDKLTVGCRLTHKWISPDVHYIFVRRESDLYILVRTPKGALILVREDFVDRVD